MNLAKIVVAIAFLAIAMPYAHAANVSLGGSLSVSGLQYLPSPAVPGQYIDVYINVQNNKAQIDSAQCELRPEYPFSLDSNEKADRQIGTIGSGQNFVLKYKVRVDASAVLGDNNLKLACKTRDTDWIEAKIAISVQSQARSLVIERIILDPAEIEPGSQGTLTLHVSNIATTPVRDVSIKLDLTSETLPFAPIESATEKNIPFIGGSQEYDVSFRLVSFADAQPKAYKIPVKISFKDYLGNSYTLNDTVGVILNSKPVLEAFVDDSKIIRENTGGTVLVKIINRGLSDAKFLNTIAKDTASVRVVEPKEFYVGNLGADDFDTIEYKLFVSKGENGTASFPLELTYRDANNNQYAQEAVVKIQLYSEDEISKLELEAKQGVNWFVILVIAAIAFGAYWFFIRKKMKFG
ncbi:COG1361 S-layer family protein [Candidatus Micrarchaeota archaeon]|nr:COG1361 S-layer family protein [Candidatus Micrarchaeota archaeon]